MHMSLNGLKPLVIGLLAAVVMIGCGAGTPEAATTSGGASTSAPVEPTESPTIISTPPPSPTLSPLVIRNLIFEQNPPDCSLPCWHRLYVGKSDSDEVYAALNTTFGINEPRYLPAGEFSPPQGYQVMGNSWSFIEPSGNHFAVVALINDKTNVLGGLRFVFLGYDPDIDPHVNPRRIIREIGMPSRWTVATEVTGQGNYLDISSLMVYDIGIVFYETFSVPLKRAVTGQTSLAEAQFCLGDSTFQSMDIDIGEPFTNGYVGLSPAQDWTYYGTVLTSPSFIPIQDVFDVSLDEIEIRISQEENPCLPTTVSNP